MSDLLLLQNALRDTLRPRRLAIAVILLLLPALLSLIWRLVVPASAWHPDDVYDSVVAPLIFSVSLTILSVVYGTGCISQEIEGRTIVYLLTRPFPRWRILLAKFIAAYVVVALVTTLSTVLVAMVVYTPAGLAKAEMGGDITALLVGAFVYGSMFLLLGTAVPRPLTYGLLFVFGWETVVPKLPGQFARVSIMTYLKVLAGREIVSSTPDTSSGNLLLMFAQPPNIDISHRLAWLILVTIATLSLVAAHVVFSTREYAPRDDSE